MAPPARAAVPDATAARHLTVDGDVGLSDDAARSLARGFFLGGFLLLPWLWFVNCYFFWPVLRYNAGHDPLLRSYVVGSAIGCSVAFSLLACWSLAYSLGGEALLGADTWQKLAVYNIVDGIM
ncbi:unnamed protein product [Closterium sp. Yama58-4]|nr:unnamed protein product [Closterium sp. Yama58-4]